MPDPDEMEFRRKLTDLREKAIAGPSRVPRTLEGSLRVTHERWRVTVDAEFLLEVIGCAELWLDGEPR